MVDSLGRSVAVWAAIEAEARAFGTFERAAKVVFEVSGIIVIVLSTLTLLLYIWVLDGVIELISSLSINRREASTCFG